MPQSTTALTIVIQKAYRGPVVLVVAALLMLAIQVMQQIPERRCGMRDAADQISPTEVLNLGDDLNRARDRVLKLQKPFGARQRRRPEI